MAFSILDKDEAEDGFLNGTDILSDLTISGDATGLDGSLVTVVLFDGVTTCTKTFTVAGGVWDVTFTAAELATLDQGNINITASIPGETDATGSFMLDTIAPDAPTFALATDTGSSPVDGITNDATVDVTGLESGATWEYSLDGGVNWLAGMGTSFEMPSDGMHDVQLRQTDAAGNLSAASATTTFALDTNADVGGDLAVTFNDLLINNAEAGLVMVTIAGLDLDASGTLEISTDGGMTTQSFAVSSNGVVGPIDITALEDGNLTATLTVTDTAGNMASATGNSAVLDTNADVGGDLAIVINDGDGFINAGEVASVSFTVNGLDADATAQVTFSDGGGSPLTMTVSGPGPHTIDLSTLAQTNISASIVATDTAGNTAFGSPDNTIIDTILPTLSSTGTTIAEYPEPNDLTPAGAVLDTFSNSDGSPGGLTYTFAGGALVEGGFELVIVGGDTELRVFDPAAFDFEDPTLPTVNIIVTDAAGNSTTTPYIVTLTDVNDAPEITGPVEDTGAVVENGVSGVYTDTGDIGFHDDDIGDIHSVNTAADGGGVGYLGVFIAGLSDSATPDGDGVVTWDFNVTNAAQIASIEALREGETLTQIYTITIMDDSGASTTQLVTVTITGTNDQPVIEGTSTLSDTLTEQAGTTGDAVTMLMADGTIDFSDADDVMGGVSVSGAEDMHSVGAMFIDAVVTLPPGLGGGTSSILELGGLSFGAVDQSGDSVDWTYTIADNALDFLDAGATLVLTYRVTITDDSGAANAASVTQDITVTITGTNDAPVIAASLTAHTYTDTAGDDTFADVAGILTSTDADDSSTATYGITGSVASGEAGFDLEVAGTYGVLYLNSVSGAYEYRPNDAAIEGLTATMTDAFILTVSDGMLSDSTTLTITLDGTNDDPVLGTAAVLGDGTEDITYIVTEAQLLAGWSDVDVGDTLSVANLTANNGATIVDNMDGTYTVTLANDFNGTMTLSYEVTDGSSPQAATLDFDVLAVADNDTVTTESSLNPNVLTAGGDLFIGTGIPGDDGQWVVATDSVDAAGVEIGLTAALAFSGGNTVDPADASGFTYVVPAGERLGTSQDNTGATFDDGYARWNFNVSIGANTDGNGGTLADRGYSFTISTLDASGMVVEIIASFTLVEYFTAILGSVAAADAFLATNDIYQDSINFEALLDAPGAFNLPFEFDPSAPGYYRIEITALNSVNGSEELSAHIDVRINSTPDAVDDADSSIVEAGHNEVGTAVAVGNVLSNDTDPDTLPTADTGELMVTEVTFGGTTFAVAAMGTTSIVGTYGTLEIAADGSWTYTLDDAAAATQALTGIATPTETFTYTVTDPDGRLTGVAQDIIDGGTTTADLNIGITGTNDGPVAENPVVISPSTMMPLIIDEDSAVRVSQFGTIFIPLSILGSDVDSVLTTNSFAFTSVDIDGVSHTLPLAGITYDGNTGISTFDPSVDAYQYLAAGEQVEVLIHFTVTDDYVASDTGTISYQVLGTNDAPEIAGGPVMVAALTETNAALSAMGSMTVTDVDVIDVVSASHVLTSATGDQDGPAALDFVAMFSVNSPVIDGTTDTGSINWTFNSAASDFDYLNDGDILVLVYTITTTDGSLSDTETVTITIVGTNDDAAITASVSEDTDVEEDGGVANGTAGDANASGTLTVADADAGESVFAAVAAMDLSGTYGTFTFNSATGAWTYVLDPALSDSLDEGDTDTDTLTVSSLDGTATYDIIVDITGTNDDPTVSAALVGSDNDRNDNGVGMDEAQVFDLFAGSGDVDDDAVLSITNLGVASSTGRVLDIADFTVDAMGNLTFDADIFRDLDRGEMEVVTFSYDVEDEHGATVAQTLTVTITGTNHAPFVIGTTGLTGNVTEQAEPELPGTVLNTSGTIEFDDYELADTHSVTVVPDVGGGMVSFDGTDTPIGVGQYVGTFSGGLVTPATGPGNGEYTWSFSVDDAVVDYLAAGEVITQNYLISITDDDPINPQTRTDTITVTITGTNDAPVIDSVAASLAFTEVGEPGAGAPDFTDTGTITFDDVDLSDIGHIASATVATSGVDGGLPSGAALSAFLVLDPVSKDSGDDFGSVVWTFTAADNVFDYLAAGEMVTLTYTVTIDDGDGGTDMQDITVVIAGTNDAPVITTAVGDELGTVTEDGHLDDGTVVLGTSSATGTLTSSDVDNGATAAWSGDAPGMYGSISIDAVTGAWTYTLDNNLAATQALTEGQIETETFTMTVSDGLGGTVTQDVIVTVTGTNDVPVANPGFIYIPFTTTLALIDEDSTHMGTLDPFTLGLLVQDVDGPLGTTSLEFTSVDIAGGPSGLTLVEAGITYNPANGEIVFTPNTAVYQYLGVDDTLTAVIHYTVTDAFGAQASNTITYSVEGTNDAPTVTAMTDVDETFAEDDGALSTTGEFDIEDVDVSDVVSVAAITVATSGNASGAPADLLTLFTSELGDTIIGGAATTGTVNWTFDTVAGDFDYLAAGESIVITYTVTISDDNIPAGTTTQDVVVTINGTNDAPVIAADLTAHTYTDTAGDDTFADIAGTLTSMDVDDGATATYGVTGGVASSETGFDLELAGTYGVLYVNSVTGAYEYRPNDAAIEGLTATTSEAFTLTVSDGMDSDSTTLTITLDGTNDNPVITTAMGGNEGSVIEAGDIVDATPVPLGADIQVNTTTLDQQIYSNVTALDGGGFVVTWTNFSGGFSAFGQRYDASGAALGGEFQIGDGGEAYTSVEGLPGGGFVATWTEAGNMFGQLYDAAGATSGAVFGINSTIAGTQRFASVTTLDGGGFVVTWSSEGGQDGSGIGVFGQLYDAAGVAVGVEFQVNTTTAGDQREPFVEALANGGFIVGWDGVDGGGNDGIFAQRFDASGVMTGTEFQVNTTEASFQRNPYIATLTDGGFIIVWEDNANGSLGQRYNADGTTSGAEFSVAPNTAISPQVVGLSDGGYVISWTGVDSDSFGIFGQRYDASGAAIGAQFQINSIEAGQQIVNGGFYGSTSFDVLSDGTLVATWSGQGPEEVFVRLIDVPASGAGTPTTTGTLTSDDVDNASTAAWSGDAMGTYGSIVIDPVTGEWVYTLDQSLADPLSDGQVVTDVFTMTVTDDLGATATQDVTITITGSNDAPTIVSGSTDSDGAVTEDATMPNLTDTGTIAFEDVDLADSHTVSVTAMTTDHSVQLGTLTPTVTTQTSGGIGGEVTWNFTVSNAAVQFLAVNEMVTETFTVTIDDGNGGTVDQIVTVVITGTNDTAVITSEDLVGAASEDDSTPNLMDSGTIEFDDVDLIDTHSASAVFSGTDNSGGQLGTLTASVNTDTSGGTGGQVTWDFTVDNALVQFLAAGETITETYTITLTDGTTGDDITRNVLVTITGTNDQPVITLGDDMGAVTEDGTTPNLTDTGTIMFSDADDTDALTSSVAIEGTPTTTGSPISGALATALNGAMGLVQTGANDGSIDWTFTLDNSLTQYLAAGETVTAVYRITVMDDSGTGTNTRTQDITVVITGTNDAPDITVDMGDSAAESIAETDAGLMTNGTLSVEDVDVSDTVSVAVSSVVESGQTSGIANGMLLAMLGVDAGDIIDNMNTDGTINWTFNSGSEAFDYLADGEDLILTYVLTVTDAVTGATDTQDVIVTINGTNDAPTISAENFTLNDGVGVADATLIGGDMDTTFVPATSTVSGQITADDVDLTDTLSFSIFDTGAVGNSIDLIFAGVTYGTLTLNTATGTYDFVGIEAAINALDFGDTVTLQTTIRVTDSALATTDALFTITLNGINDAPIANDDSTTINEGAISLFNVVFGGSTGMVIDTDAEGHAITVIGAGDALDASSGQAIGGSAAVTAAVPGTFFTDWGAQVTIQSNGLVTYNLTSSSAEFNRLAGGEVATDTFTYTISDGNGGTDTATVSVEITGTNDPITAVDDTISATEDVALGQSGDLVANDTDVDVNDS